MSPAQPSGTGAPNPGGDSSTMSSTPRCSSSATSSDQIASTSGLPWTKTLCASCRDECSTTAVAPARIGRRSRRRPGVRCRGHRELSERSRTARRLGSVLEPVVGQVYFSPECHADYVALGFDPEPGRCQRSRAARWPVVLRQPWQRDGAGARRGDRRRVRRVQPGDRRAARRRSPGQRTDAATIRDATGRGCCRPAAPVARRRTGRRRTGRRTARHRRGARCRSPAARWPPASARSPFPPTRSRRSWHHGDFLREYRGDSHNAAWVSAGFTATQIGLLTEMYWGLGMRTYSRSRGWTEAQFDAAEAGLRDRGLLDGDGFSDAGREAARSRSRSPPTTRWRRRSTRSVTTCSNCSRSWSRGVPRCAAGLGYLSDGPHDLAKR